MIRFKIDSKNTIGYISSYILDLSQDYFTNGKILNDDSLQNIRDRVNSNI